MKKLRLLLFEECNRACPGCCNKDWNLSSLSIISDFSGYDIIMLTGGEPMLRPELIKRTVKNIRKQHVGPIYLYTAKVDNLTYALEILYLVDGFVVTLHNLEDVISWELFNAVIPDKFRTTKSMRLNIFSEVGLTYADLNTADWDVKDNMFWQKDCPLPQDEVFGRLLKPVFRDGHLLRETSLAEIRERLKKQF